MECRIVTLTMNPAVDTTVEVDRIFAGHKLRCDHVRRDPGGGGINVARVVHRLGGDAVAVFPAGGPLGEVLDNLLKAEGINEIVVPIAGETREDFAVDDRSTAEQYRFVMPGPPLSAREVDLCLDLVRAELRPPCIFVASGSLPRAVSVEFYAQCAASARALDIKFVLDSSGAPLRDALGAGVYLIKPSLRELEGLAGRSLETESAQLAAACELIAARQCEQVALTLGAGGALLVGRGYALRATAPRIDAASTVGAGDSFLGAMVYAMGEERAPEDALRLATAAGSAALLSRGTGLCTLADIERLARDVAIGNAA